MFSCGDRVRHLWNGQPGRQVGIVEEARNGLAWVRWEATGRRSMGIPERYLCHA